MVFLLICAHMYVRLMRLVLCDGSLLFQMSPVISRCRTGGQRQKKSPFKICLFGKNNRLHLGNFHILKCTNINIYFCLFTFNSHFLLNSELRDLLDSLPAELGRKQDYTFNKSPMHQRATLRQTTIDTHTHTVVTDSLEFPVDLSCMFLGGGRKLENHLRTHAEKERTCELNME